MVRFNSLAFHSASNIKASFVFVKESEAVLYFSSLSLAVSLGVAFRSNVSSANCFIKSSEAPLNLFAAKPCFNVLKIPSSFIAAANIVTSLPKSFTICGRSSPVIPCCNLAAPYTPKAAPPAPILFIFSSDIPKLRANSIPPEVPPAAKRIVPYIRAFFSSSALAASKEANFGA